jgi:hypothetical protein
MTTEKGPAAPRNEYEALAEYLKTESSLTDENKASIALSQNILKAFIPEFQKKI